MNYLIKNAKVVDANSPQNTKRVDILVEQGIITQMGSNLKTDKNVKVIEQENLHASPGWFDMQANFCDPGFEHKEDLQTGMQAAAQGGFTGVCVMPATNPPLHSKSQIDYVINACKNNLVDVFPAGCLTQNSDGKEMTEMHDMKQAGAIAFTDYKNSIKDSDLLVRLLQYAENTGSLIITHCEDKSLASGGQMNEGETATHLGLKGIPALAEELMVQRNINLLTYAGGKMHIPTISTKQSADYIKQAKNKNLHITSGIAAHQLLLNDAIDVIVSDHCPEEIENKDVEFDHASFGIIALETAYASANTALHGKIEGEKLIEKLSSNPRKILGLHVPILKVGEKANITLFNPDMKWEFTQKHISSKSKNTPFINYHFIGKAIAVINNGKMNLCN